MIAYFVFHRQNYILQFEGYRLLICKKHVAVYRVIHETVYIYHIADTQTEYTKLFYN